MVREISLKNNNDKEPTSTDRHCVNAIVVVCQQTAAFDLEPHLFIVATICNYYNSEAVGDNQWRG